MVFSVFFFIGLCRMSCSIVLYIFLCIEDNVSWNVFGVSFLFISLSFELIIMKIMCIVVECVFFFLLRIVIRINGVIRFSINFVNDVMMFVWMVWSFCIILFVKKLVFSIFFLLKIWILLFLNNIIWLLSILYFEFVWRLSVSLNFDFDEYYSNGIFFMNGLIVRMYWWILFRCV